MAKCAEYNQYCGTEEEKRSLIMEVYYPFIIETVRSTDILVHLVQLQDHFSELRMLDKEGRHAESMMMLLRYLDTSKHPQKWRPFIDALKSAGYEDLYRGLEYGEDISTSENETKYKQILQFLPTLIERVRLENSGILPFLLQNGVISEHQLESIRACSRYHSNRDALLELIVHLHTKTQKWYTVFLEALLQDGHNVLVENIDPEFMLGKKRTRKMTFNFNSFDYEEEDRLSVDGEADESVLLTACPTSNPQDQEDTRNEESSDSNKSMPDIATHHITIRDYEILFPTFPKCPRIEWNDEEMVIKFMESLTFSEGATCTCGAHTDPENTAKIILKGLYTDLESWKTNKFKPWCEKMENFIHHKAHLIRNRDDLFYLVEKWLLYLQNCVENEYGETDMSNAQIESISEFQTSLFSRFVTCFDELLTAVKECKDSVIHTDNVMLVHVNGLVAQIKNGQVDSIENFQTLELSEDLRVAGISYGKVIKYIGLMWKNLK